MRHDILKTVYECIVYESCFIKHDYGYSRVVEDTTVTTVENLLSFQLSSLEPTFMIEIVLFYLHLPVFRCALPPLKLFSNTRSFPLVFPLLTAKMTFSEFDGAGAGDDMGGEAGRNAFFSD